MNRYSILTWLSCFVAVAGLEAQSTRSLAGSWRFALDRADSGIAEHWFTRRLDQRLQLPGALQNQGFGDDITLDTKWTGAVGVERWLDGPQYANYRQPGNIKVPFFLQPEKHYVGAAWYQRDITIPAGWAARRVVLTLERPHWGTQVWLDDRLVGAKDSLATPHVYALGAGAEVAPGPHVLTIRVDNRILQKVGDWSHSVSDHTQGNWNGIVGRIELTATPWVWIEDLQVYPHVATRSVTVRGKIGNGSGKSGHGELTLTVEPATPPRSGIRKDAKKFPPVAKTVPIDWQASGGEFESEMQLPNSAGTWNEFHPNLLKLIATLSPDNVAHQLRPAATKQAKAVVFGLREITAANRQFYINRQPTFFRGTLECSIFPLTGYPPTGTAYWQKIIRACQAYGLNHIRFHSWCPPEAAFVAADELGFYYQVECGVWTNPGENQAIGDWIYRESERIVRAYGNHPSFVLLTHGNEPHGSKRDEFLTGWVNHWKQKDPRRLVTSGSAYPQLPVNQYHVYHGPRGPKGWLGRDYTEAIKHLAAPVIVHEMGQWCAYPDFDFIAKCTGPLKAHNFEIFRDSLAEHGLLNQWRDFLRASGKLQVLCYQEEIEAALRTPGVGGVQLLDLHDFPGQGTALVGVLDALWESKGYVKPEEFRAFCNATVPLARLLKRTWTTSETLTARVEVAHFGPAPIDRAVIGWRLESATGQVVTHGRLAERPLPLGKGIQVGEVDAALNTLVAPARYRLVVSIENAARAGAAAKAWSRNEKPSGPGAARLEAPSSGGSSLRPPEGGTPNENSRTRSETSGHFENHWNIWVYPDDPPAAAPPNVYFTTALDDAAMARLAAGGRVLLATDKLSPAHPKLGFEPIFWNRYMFNTQSRQTLGLLCQPRHPALARFPTDDYQDWQWRDIVTQARGVILDELPPALRPIVQPIDDWNTNRKLGLIFECRVGSGRLLVCAADLSRDLDRRPAARQLRASLSAYAAGGDFHPQVAVNEEQLRATLLWAARSTLVNLGAKVVRADSEDRANGNTADKAIDGDPDTIWHTQWGNANPGFPHELVIDLGRELELTGFRLLPRQEQSNGWFTRYRFEVSRDGREWGVAAAKGRFPADRTEKKVTFVEKRHGRFIRLVALEGYRHNPWAAIAELDVMVPKQTK